MGKATTAFMGSDTHGILCHEIRFFALESPDFGGEASFSRARSCNKLQLLDQLGS